MILVFFFFLILSFKLEQHYCLALLLISCGTLGQLFKVPNLSPLICKMGIEKKIIGLAVSGLGRSRGVLAVAPVLVLCIL